MDVLLKMVEAMVVTLREGVEVALVVGVVLAYLRKTGRVELSRYLFRGLWAALLASLFAALLVQKFGWDPENELLEGSLMLVAALFVSSLLIWMWKAGKTLKQRMETRLQAVTSGRAGAGLFLFSFLMVFREGVEAVLFLFALSATIGANPMFNLLGGGVGLLLAFLFGWLLVKGSVRINLKRFFTATSFVLTLLVIKLVANGLHEFFEAGLIPSNESLLVLVGFLTQERTSILILIGLILLPALIMLRDAWGLRPQLDGSLSLPDQRKKKAEVRSVKRSTTVAAGVALGISSLLGLSLVASATRGYDPTPVRLAFGDEIRLPLEAIHEHAMQKYVVNLAGVDVRFFIVRSREGKIAGAFDACNICPLKGYVLEGEQLVCRNCGAPIAFATIGTPGGCNPLPLKAMRINGHLVIDRQALAEGRARFDRAGK